MNWVEIAAVVLTVVSVLLSVKRNIWQFPVGMIATAIYVAVFHNAQLYASAGLNVVFCLVQVYGLWFWLRGDNGKAPPVGSWPWASVAMLSVGALAGASCIAYALQMLTDAALPYADAAIFGLSLAAQFLLSRKKIETWALWRVVNLLSVATYAAQGLWPTALLYAALFVNVFWGWSEWRKAMRTEAPA